MSPDEKLQSFLASHRPTAPNAPSGLRDATWAKINRRPLIRIAAPVASLGFAALLVIFLQSSPVSEGSRVAANLESSFDLSFLTDDTSSDDLDPLSVLADAM